MGKVKVLASKKAKSLPSKLSFKSKKGKGKEKGKKGKKSSKRVTFQKDNPRNGTVSGSEDDDDDKKGKKSSKKVTFQLDNPRNGTGIGSEDDDDESLEMGSDLEGSDDVMPSNGQAMDAEEEEFLEKTRQGLSFPIVRDRIEGESDQDEDEDAEDFSEASMKKLQEKDPEFFKYLLDNDKDLLDYEDEKDEDENEGDDNEGQKAVKVTETMISDWSDNLREQADKATIRTVVNVFKAAVVQASGESALGGGYRVEGADLFNSVIKLCFVDLLPAFNKFLHLPPPTVMQTTEGKLVNPSKSNSWKKLVSPIKTYLTNVVKVLDVISEDSIVASVLRHCLHLIPYFNCFVHLSKRILKKVTELWSQGEEKVRILSFLCILRLMRDQESEMLSFILKKLYISFIKNCKFTSPTTWPLINFMRQSLVELYSLDQGVAYQHAFVFIRQCAIHLRNAMTGAKKDALNSVYNWQYVHSLLLWQQMLTCLHPSEVLKPLLYPLVQVITGTIRLIPASKYFPLRFHLIRGLIRLSEATDTFIPVLPLIVNVLDQLDYKKKVKVVESKKMDFNCILRVTKNQVHEKQFKDITVNKVYEVLLDYLSTQSHRIAFPELVFIPFLKIKKYLKSSCKNGEHSRLLKQAQEKIEENIKYIEQKRKGVTFKFTDTKAVDAWERDRRDEGPPVTKFFEQWQKLKIEREKMEIGKDAVAEKDKKRKGGEKEKEKRGDKQQKQKGQAKEKAKKRKTKGEEGGSERSQSKRRIKKARAALETDIRFEEGLELSSDDE